MAIPDMIHAKVNSGNMDNAMSGFRCFASMEIGGKLPEMVCAQPWCLLSDDSVTVSDIRRQEVKLVMSGALVWCTGGGG